MDLLRWLVIAVLAVIVFLLRKPLIGLLFVAAAEPLSTLLPRVPFASSVMVFAGALTLASLALVALHEQFQLKARPGPIYRLLAWLVVSYLLGQYLLTNMSFANRNYFFTFLQLAILVWLTDELVADPSGLRQLSAVYVATAVASAALGALQFFHSPSSAGELFRPKGLGVDANELALYSGVGAVLCYGLSRSLGGRLRVFLVWLAALLAISMLVSGSRGGMTVFALCLLYMILRIRGSGTRIGVLGFATLVVAFLGLTWTMLPSALVERIHGIPGAVIHGSDTAGLRYQAWWAALKLWARHPWLGIGPGMFQYYNIEYHLVKEARHMVAHSMYATTLSENGLFGFVPFMGILGYAWVSIRRTSKLAPADSPVAPLALAWEVTFLLLLLDGIVLEVSYLKILWIAVGAILALERIGRDDVGEPIRPDGGVS